MKSAAFFWLVLLVVFLIAEAACPIHLVSIWFALGALVALLCAALGAPVWLQITLFVVVSGVLLALLWPLAKKFLNSKVTATNAELQSQSFHLRWPDGGRCPWLSRLN